MDKELLICIDFDDCIFPSPAPTEWCTSEIALKTLEINLIKLQMLMDNTSAKVFITSSWSQMFIHWPEHNTITVKDEVRNEWKLDLYEIPTEEQAYVLMSKYLNKYIVGICDGNRTRSIKKLDDGTRRIVVFDDFDLTECDSVNVMTYDVTGCLNNDILWRAYDFLKEN